MPFDTLLIDTANGLLLAATLVEFVCLCRKYRTVTHSKLRGHCLFLMVLFLLLFIHVLTSLRIYDSGRAEVFSAFPIGTLFLASTVFAMLACAFFGRNHHRNLFIWFILLQYPLLMMTLNLFMRMSGKYVRLYSFQEIMAYSEVRKFIFYGRITWLIFVVFIFLFMAGMVVEAYCYYIRRCAAHYTAVPYGMRRSEIVTIFLFAVLLIPMMSSYFVPSLCFHAATNIIMAVMVVRMCQVFMRHLRYVELHSQEQERFHTIHQRLVSLLEREHDNPVYSSNSKIKAVAAAIGVDKDVFSDYLYKKLNTTYPAWMSEQKMQHCARQLVLTNRQVKELAISCGYSNITALNRAFKTRFGMTPSEYRLKNRSH